jgi:hypothetical protein
VDKKHYAKANVAPFIAEIKVLMELNVDDKIEVKTRQLKITNKKGLFRYRH